MPILDTLDSASPEASVSSDSDSTDFAALRKKIFGNRNKPSKRKPAESSPEEPDTEAELNKLFAGENWEEVASLYFDARFAMTGYENFQLTKGQKSTLGLSLGRCMKMLLKIDPGYIALLIFTANFGGLIAQKEMLYNNELKIAERDRKPHAIS